ncbi:amidase [Salinimonas lutimaris]|uniref:amidase n=1 Tax=Salinimonas lutimaris TaxID=914153 RepID=UPI0010C1210D|nr:amidase [Salinimonas lutimaris]
MKNKRVTSPFVEGTEQAFTLYQAGTQQAQPLKHLRLAVKDLFHMQGLPTSAGNPDWLLSHPVAETTHSSVITLLQAGARFVGKTITDELAYSLNGQNAHYGTPQNPVTPDRLPGGSSSGSAVAVAAGLADIGLGTDTGGSIRVPASYQGLFGLRPTHGAVPCDNMVALAPSFDTVGWMTRSLSVMRSVAEVLLGSSDSRAPSCGVAILSAHINAHPYTHQLKHTLRQWEKTDLAFTPVDAIPADLALGEAFRYLQGAEIAREHGSWLQQQKPIIAPDIQARLDWCMTITAQQEQQARQTRTHWCEIIYPLLDKYEALIIPTTPGLAPRLTTPDSSLSAYRQTLLTYTAMAGLAGLPQLHIPCLTEHGAPYGLSLIGARNSEQQLLQLAHQLTES